ncbi:hypothetical protein [Maricaulis alexandrii]|uniref:hypothetical protein n=1 Tax=Maricaulis alexandrii TaxID=2570354 RepID=UPI00110991EB|nr:hypothetical protein [Maricaulis alexandrii]
MRHDPENPAHAPLDKRPDVPPPRTKRWSCPYQALLKWMINRQWARIEIGPNIKRWNHPGGLYGLVVDGKVDLATVPLPENFPGTEQEWDLYEAHPELGTKVDPDAPHPGPGWERARIFRGWVEPGEYRPPRPLLPQEEGYAGGDYDDPCWYDVGQGDRISPTLLRQISLP